MLIERVQVDDGFLSGLDVGFASGLNVLIGARGTGKTSLIELIRFALDAPSITEGAGRRGHQQALNVLRDGRVSVIVRDGEDRFIVSRSASDETPRTPRPIPPMTVLAQSEIEAVGAQAVGRLHLIDRLRIRRHQVNRQASGMASEIRSLTAEISGIRRELNTITKQIDQMQTVRRDLSEALAEQQKLMRSIAATEGDRQKLAALQHEVAVLGVRGTVYQRTESAFADFLQRLVILTNSLPHIEEWPEGAGVDDPLQEVRLRRHRTHDTLNTAASIVESALREVHSLQIANTELQLNASEKARESRRELNELHAGAGAMARKVEDLTEKAAQLNALANLLTDRTRRIESLQETRRQRYADLEELRSHRFGSRRDIADRLNTELMPEIRTDIVESGSTGRYANAVITALRGSGLHYNSLAPLIAERMSPLEFVEAIESQDQQSISDATSISIGRAYSVISYLQSRQLTEIVAAPIEDAVDLSLLDGIDYKSSDTLSIGQRCTVVLPLLLSGRGELLIVDQPEDHLDNAFITETLVDRLRNREPSDQYIFASHNANVPVLGEADLIIRLGSDGRRGFVLHKGELSDIETVRAITAVMEGGVEAFRRRAAFYAEVLETSDEHQTSIQHP